MKRVLYFLYYLKELDRDKVKRFLRQAKRETNVSTLHLWRDVIASVWKYNISILDYFYFRFYRATTDRDAYAGTGFMYEYQLKMNPRPNREVLASKLLFLKTVRKFINREVASIDELEKDPEMLARLIAGSPEFLVLKGSRGQTGKEVEVIRKSEFTSDTLTAYMKKNHYDLVEEYVIQHDDLMKLSPSGLNTVRIITQLENGDVNFLAARLRITINSSVDNLAAGNIAAPVDLQTGSVTGPGVFSDITKEEVDAHPVTGQPIVGFQVPRWNEVRSIVEQAALLIPGNRSVGWDVAITNDHVELIEGNHNWCKLLWQLPVRKGLKHELQRFL